MQFTEIASAPIRQALLQVADAKGRFGFDKFIEIALYDPEFGYYRANRVRVGRQIEADFFTASSLSSTFSSIVIESSLGLLEQAGIRPENTAWIEIGAEPQKGLLTGIDTPFETVTSLGVGDEIEIRGNAIVFSNELFDAQPFHSIIYSQGSWKERLIEVADSGLRIVEVEPCSQAVLERLAELPNPAPSNYIVDLPTGSKTLLDTIVSQDWQGAFIGFDYGKTWKALTHDTPQGTARAYSKHRQNPDLLENIGTQDLTTHVCWDWLQQGLEESGFDRIELESQESYILKRAPELVASAFTPQSRLQSELKGHLQQLIHPTLMGQKFQVLSGVRHSRAQASCPR